MQLNEIFVFSSLLLVSIFHRVNGQDNEYQIWQNAGITPIPIQTVPPIMAEVVYNHSVYLNIGQPLTASQVDDKPVSIAYPYSLNEQYTFMCFDTSPLYLQWLSINNPGQAGYIPNTKGTDSAPYVAPAPAPGSGIHYYVVLIFQQTYNLDIEINDRLGFNYTIFANDNDLILNSGTFFYIST